MQRALASRCGLPAGPQPRKTQNGSHDEWGHAHAPRPRGYTCFLSYFSLHCATSLLCPASLAPQQPNPHTQSNTAELRGTYTFTPRHLPHDKCCCNKFVPERQARLCRVSTQLTTTQSATSYVPPSTWQQQHALCDIALWTPLLLHSRHSSMQQQIQS
jgi:hypothetical protein